MHLSLYLITFLMAFCSFCYEILIATRLSRIVGQGMFIYPACIAVFILFMGIGSAIWSRQKEKSTQQLLSALFTIEWQLTMMGIISILAIDLTLYDSLYTINPEAFAVGLLIAAGIGFLSGQELPVIFQLCHKWHLGHKQIRRVIFFDYLASFFASVSCILFLIATFGVLKTSVFISFINVIVMALIFCLLIIPIRLKSHPTPLLKPMGMLLISFTFYGYLFGFGHLDTLENKLLKRVYTGSRNAQLLKKTHTPYQQVLLFAMRKDYVPFSAEQQHILQHPDQYYLFAVLNGTLQFFEPFEAKADHIHTYLFDPFMKIFGHLHDVLILGGGGGLPARQAVSYDSIQTISMVDIDAHWVNLAKENPYLKMKSRQALKDPRLTIHIDDAFKWIVKTKHKYDFIVVDFPSEPFTLAKMRTGSVQFFADLKRILTDQGMIVLYSTKRSSLIKQQTMAKPRQQQDFIRYSAIRKTARAGARSNKWSCLKRRKNARHSLRATNSTT